METTDRRAEDHKEDKTPMILAVGTTLMIFTTFIIMMFFPVPKENTQSVIQLVTAMIATWGLACGFYYNTNKNAAKAQDTMNKQAETAKQAGAALAAVAPVVAASAGTSTPGEISLPQGKSVEITATGSGTPDAPQV